METSASFEREMHHLATPPDVSLGEKRFTPDVAVEFDALGHATRSERCEQLRHQLPQQYAILRPGRTHDHVGPVIAESRTDLAALLGAIADRADGSVLIDVLDPVGVGDLLQEMGLECQRELTRMAHRNSERLLAGPDVVAAAGFELG